jgi:hypothetical protein
VRLSIYETDPGYQIDWMNYLVCINGERCDFFVTADEELGVAYVIKHDAYKKILLNEQGNIDIEEIYGLVEIIKK